MPLSKVESELLLRLSAPQIFRHVEALCGFGPRPLGSCGDEKAIKYLEEESRSFGAEFETADFEIAVSRQTKAELRLISPEQKSIQCRANYRSAPSPPEGITTNNVVDVGYGIEEGYEGKNAAGAIVLAWEGSLHPVAKSELAVRKGAAGCVWINRRQGGLISTYGLPRYGSKIPIVSISHEDGELLRRLLREHGIALAMHVDTDLKRSRGKQAMAIVRGHKRPEELCILCAHRETVPDSAGANDNASGVGVVLEVLKALTSYQPQRTFWGLFSTGEEGGAIGMRAFVASNEALIQRVGAIVNIDVIGEGPELTMCTEGRWPDRTVMTSDGLNKVFFEAAQDLGYRLESSVSNMGLADTEAFINAGVPGSWIRRTGHHYLHTAEDLPQTIDANALKVVADIVMVALVRLDQMASLDSL